MARNELTTLTSLRAVVKEMRDLGVASWVGSPVGDLVLGAAPAPRATKVDLDPKAQRRAHYEGLFNRPVTDAELEKLP